MSLLNPSPEELDAPTNGLLAAMPQSQYQRLRPHLKALPLSHGDTLMQMGQPLEHVYFRNVGVISAVLISTEGTPVEVGIIGCDGVAGAGAALTNGKVPFQHIVQIPGVALRLPVEVFRDEFRHDEKLQEGVLRYWQVLTFQTATSALCNRLHTLEERLSRWLLMVHDLTPGEELPLTQEFISHMLGVRRSGVTIAAGILQSAGLIHYRRGCIAIKDRDGLKESSCGCYELIARQSQELLG